MNLVGKAHMGQRRGPGGFPKDSVGQLSDDYSINDFRTVTVVGWNPPESTDYALPLKVVKELRRST